MRLYKIDFIVYSEQSGDKCHMFYSKNDFLKILTRDWSYVIDLFCIE